MLRAKALSLTLLLSLLASLQAQESFDALDGFESELDGFSIEETQATQTQEEKAHAFTGKLSFKSSYGYKSHSVDGVNYEGVNQAQSAIFLQYDSHLSEDWRVRMSGDGFYDAYYELSQKDFNADVLESYETQLRLDDVYIQGKLSQNIDAKIGRQIVVWGKSDSIRITDVINPLDNRLPGMTDIKDLRLSTSMAKLDYYIGSWNISMMLIPESRIFLEPAPRGEFFPVDALFPAAPRPFLSLQNPKNGFEDGSQMQYALAINGVFSGWDASFYAADVLDSRWHIKGTLPNATREVSKIQMFGGAFNVAKGSWLFKSEVAFLKNLAYNSTQEKKSRFDALIGFDYVGMAQSLLSLEIANRHIFGYETQMGGRAYGVIPDFVQRDEVQTTLRVTRSYLNETLNATLFLSMFGHNWEYGGFARGSLAYKLKDGLLLSAGVIEYLAPKEQNTRPLMDAISNNARIFIDISYSF